MPRATKPVARGRPLAAPRPVPKRPSAGWPAPAAAAAVGVIAICSTLVATYTGLPDLDAESFWLPLVLSTVAGLSTGLGALVVLAFRGAPEAWHMAFSLALAGGVMVGVTLIELWVPFLLAGGSIPAFSCSVLAGVVAYWILSRCLPPNLVEDLEHGDKDRNRSQAANWRLALVMMVVLTVHNFPEGIAVAVSAASEQRLGFVMMFAIAIHNIPEGIAVAVPAYQSSGCRWRAVKMALLSGMSEPLGALIALLALRRVMTELVTQLVLISVGGMMFSVAVMELVPESGRYNAPRAQAAGFLAGVAVMAVTSYVAG